MKIAYIKGNRISASQEVRNMKAYNNSVLEKVAYEKFKKAINRCFEIVTSICVGMSFSSCVIGYGLHDTRLSLDYMIGTSELGINTLGILLTIWGIGYMITKMRNTTVKEFFNEISSMLVRFSISSILAIFGGGIMWELFKMFLL